MGKEIDEVVKANRLGKKLASHKKGRVSRYQPYGSKRRSIGHSGQSQARLDERGHSRSQDFFRSAEHRSLEIDYEASNSPQDNPGITPPHAGQI